jgi:hypothetical protein
MTLTLLPWYTGIILAMAEFFGMHHVSVAYNVILPHKLNRDERL